MSADPRELIDAYLDGELAPEQERELEAWLAADPEHLKTFVRETHAHGQLRMLFKAEAAGSAPWPRSAKALGPRRHAGRAVWWLAAALLALTVTVYFFRNPSAAVEEKDRTDGDKSGSGRAPELASQPEADVNHSVVMQGRVLVEGIESGRIPTGRAIEVAGIVPAVIRLTDGSKLTLWPSSKALLPGARKDYREVVALQSGRGDFSVNEGQGQFLVETPAGNVVVLGTEFTVEVGSKDPGTREKGGDGMSKLSWVLAVAVVAGNVRVEVNNRQLELSAGESRVFAADDPEDDAEAGPGRGLAIAEEARAGRKAQGVAKATEALNQALSKTPQEAHPALRRALEEVGKIDAILDRARENEAEGGGREEARAAVERGTKVHLDKLKELQEQVPEEAREAIGTAIQESQRGRNEALQALDRAGQAPERGGERPGRAGPPENKGPADRPGKPEGAGDKPGGPGGRPGR